MIERMIVIAAETIWKARYAGEMVRYFRESTQPFTYREAWQHAETSLENLENDLTYDPVDTMHEDISYWGDD